MVVYVVLLLSCQSWIHADTTKGSGLSLPSTAAIPSAPTIVKATQQQGEEFLLYTFIGSTCANQFCMLSGSNEDKNAGVILGSRDFGQNWDTLQSVSGLKFQTITSETNVGGGGGGKTYFMAVAEVSLAELFTHKSGGAIFISSDFGSTWSSSFISSSSSSSSSSLISFPGLIGASFGGGGEEGAFAFVVGKQGTILSSSIDSNFLSWKKETSSVDKGIDSFQFNAIATSSRPLQQKQQQSSEEYEQKFAIVAVGSRGIIWYAMTKNYHDQESILWKMGESGVDSTLNCVSIFFERGETFSTAIAAGEFGVVLTSRDGGVSWNPLPSSIFPSSSLSYLTFCAAILRTTQVRRSQPSDKTATTVVLMGYSNFTSLDVKTSIFSLENINEIGGIMTWRSKFSISDAALFTLVMYENNYGIIAGSRTNKNIFLFSDNNLQSEPTIVNIITPINDAQEIESQLNRWDLQDDVTQNPTSQPSSQPSSMPTNQPSTQPSMQPTHQPSSQPTSQPSMQPSADPSVQPTSQPSNQPSCKCFLVVHFLFFHF